jgi:pSer/pThr/pTyr-binding forkhead associated (FHA) protein
MECYFCKEKIDDDSLYCDQCGKQILVCPVCGRQGKGPRCIHDGEKMVPAGSTNAPAQTGAQVQTPVQTGTTGQTPVQTGVQGQTGDQVQTPSPVTPVPVSGGNDSTKKPVSNAVKFTGNGITFTAKDGDVIGRKTGSFVGIFSTYQYVSGTHCKIVKMPGGWHIQDLGSTNGTFVQGTQIAPNVPHPLTNNCAVKIATSDFTVTF